MSAVLATLAELKTYIKKTLADKDTLLQSLLDNGERHIETLINRKFSQTTYKELYSGDAARCIYLDHYPIITLTVFSTDVDKENLEYTVDIVLTQLMIDLNLGRITALSDSLFKGFLNIYVEYSAGYVDDTTVPLDLKQVLIEMAAAKFYTQDEKRTGITSKNVMSENITFTFQDLNSNQKKVIEQYRKPPGIKGVTALGFNAV